MAMKELRLDVDESDLAVLDGFVAATGTSKAEAIVICRMTRVNPLTQDAERITGAL